MSIRLKSPQILKYVEQTDAVLWHKVLYHASKMGDLDALKSLSIQNEDTSTQACCLKIACEHGHRHIMDFFLDHVKQFQFDKQSYHSLLQSYCRAGLIGASKGDHLDIIKMVIQNYQPSTKDVVWALQEACLTCSWNVLFFLKETFNISPIRALRQACEGKHRKLVDWLIENGDDDWESGFIGACEAGDVSLIQLMIPLIIKRGAINLRLAFMITSRRQHVEASKYLLELGKLTVVGEYLGCNADITKLLIEYDDTRAIPILASHVCPLLNKGVSLSTLLQYKQSGVVRRIVCLAEKLLEVVKSSLRDVLCTDLIITLNLFIGYDVNKQVVEAIR